MASELFFEQGYHATSMRQIADGADVRVGSLYNHFTNKEDLLFRIAYETMEEMIAGARTAICDQQDAASRLRAFISFHTTYCVERRFQARVADDFLHLLGMDSRKAVVGLRDEYERMLRSILSDGADAREWLVDEAGLIAFGVVTMITDVRLWYRPDGRLSLEQVADYYATFVLRALGESTVSSTDESRNHAS
ncbi:MAG: TetR/AcrR family transcriptional regulator [Anaerolineaceae bacterium]